MWQETMINAQKQKIKDNQRWEPHTKPGLTHVLQGETHLLLDVCHVPCYSEGIWSKFNGQKSLRYCKQFLGNL